MRYRNMKKLFRSYDTALELEPNEPVIYFNKGNIYFNIEEYELGY